MEGFVAHKVVVAAGDGVLRRAGQPVCGLFVGNDVRDLCVEEGGVALGGVDEGLQVGAEAGDEHEDAGEGGGGAGGRHCGRGKNCGGWGWGCG